ncbi:DUF547 domain-containing protein [Reichenbachiella sp. MALMAid0571]|uniref:DUF547 domain-containing protein n=1 Tax=Reichenbachiella sp. MALMAid0571 TaxID=3143939 RepID=UPI0032DF68DB
MNTFRIKLFVILNLLSLSLFGCDSLNPSKKGTVSPDHEIFDKLLGKYVDKEGNVNYKGFLDEKSKLELYLKVLNENPPDVATWPQDDQIAFWINAYNAFTLKLIIDNYPIKSIKDIGSKLQIPFVNTPWDIKFIKIGGEEYDLNNIEHNILRKTFDEPRIHFAIVCASFSCPKLRPEAYTGEKLDAQLTQQAKSFLADTNKNQITETGIKISKIFSWFKGDFTKNETLIDFLNKYAPVMITPDADVSYLKYDWSLNEQK